MKNSNEKLEKKLAKAKALIAKQQEEIDVLKAEANNSDAKLWKTLEDLFRDKKYFHYPEITSLNVKDPFSNEKIELEIDSSCVVCILNEESSRRKRIYIGGANGDRISFFTINNNEINLKKLCKKLDPLSHYLVQISKHAIVNVKFYDLFKGGKLELNQDAKEFEPEIKTVKISKEMGLKSFNKVKEFRNNKDKLQKRLVNYSIIKG